MANKFLLPCPQCGETVSVQASQAGSTLVCRCGNPIEVPTIRQLQQFESVGEASETAASTWSARSGTKLFGLFLAIIAALPGVYWLATWPERPERDVPKIIDMAEKTMSELPIDRAWFYWYNEVELRGLEYNPAADEIAYLERVQRLRWYCMASFGVSAIGMLVVLAAIFSKPATQ